MHDDLIHDLKVPKVFKRTSKNGKEDGKLNVAAPRGVYVHGSVGSGKTLLMDFFYKTATLSKKQRIHFHQFMLDVHKRTYAEPNRQVVAGRYSHKKAK